MGRRRQIAYRAFGNISDEAIDTLPHGTVANYVSNSSAQRRSGKLRLQLQRRTLMPLLEFEA